MDRLTNLTSDRATLELIGERIARERLGQNRRQSDVAEEAGISRKTLIRLEAGQDVSLTTFLRVLRALNLMENLSLLLPEPGPSPIELLKLQGKRRSRAS